MTKSAVVLFWFVLCCIFPFNVGLYLQNMDLIYKDIGCSCHYAIKHWSYGEAIHQTRASGHHGAFA